MSDHSLPWKRKPFTHQVTMAEWHYGRRYSGDASEVGTGKTAPIIVTIAQFLKDSVASSALVIAPNSILDNWADEIKVNSDLSCSVLRGEKKKRLELLSKPADVYVINYEGVRTIVTDLIAKNFNIVVCDEVHHLKDPRSKQTKAILALSRGAYIRKAMSGTMVSNQLFDIWSIAEFVNPSIFKTNFWGFRAKYMEDKNAGKPWMKFPDWVPKTGAVEAIREKLSPHFIRYEKKDVLPFLPPVLFEKRMVAMTPEQQRVYKELKREFIAELEGGEILLAPQILTRITKLLQIGNGFFYRTTDEPAYHFEHNPKINELRAVLDEIGSHQAVIMAAYTEEIELISGVVENCTVMTGTTKQDFRQPICRAFEAGEFQYLVANPACAGEGLNLTAASYMIFFSRSWKLLERTQSLGRVHRPGAERHDNITIIDLITEGSMDEKVFAALENKEDLSKSVNPRTVREWLR